MLKSPNVIRYPQYISFKFQIFLYPKISIDWRETSFEVMFTLYKYLHTVLIHIKKKTPHWNLPKQIIMFGVGFSTNRMNVDLLTYIYIYV